MRRSTCKRSSVRLAALTLCLALAPLAAGCGGGGGGGGGGGEPALLALYRYLWQTEGEGLIITLTDGVLRVSTDSPQHVQGTYDTATRAWTIAAASRFEIVDVGQSLLGDLSVQVTTEIAVPEDDNPTAGAYQVTAGGDRIIVTVNPALPGVTIQNDVGANGSIEDTADLTWTQFDDLQDTDPAYQRIAEFARGGLEFILEQSVIVLNSIDLLRVNRTTFPTTNPIDVACDPIDPPFTPVGVPTPGSSSLAWIDDTGDGIPGAGDDFLWTFQDCWINDPADDVDDFFNGNLRLLDLTETVDAGNRLTRVGYEAPGGGVLFEAFSPAETETDAANNVTPGEIITVDGQLTLVFFE